MQGVSNAALPSKRQEIPYPEEALTLLASLEVLQVDLSVVMFYGRCTFKDSANIYTSLLLQTLLPILMMIALALLARRLKHRIDGQDWKRFALVCFLPLSFFICQSRAHLLPPPPCTRL